MKISRNGKSNLSYFHNKLIVFKFVAENYTYNYKQTINTNLLSITRGYCAHEHWNQFGLIDMNFAIKREQSEYVATYSAIPSVSKMGEANFGRFYDPVVGRFLSPDPYVQDLGNPQNFNRYSYCLNNPLKYNDPSGEFVVSAAIIMGTLAGIAMGMFQADRNGHSWGDGSYWRYMTCGGVIGAASGAAGAYVGSTVGGYFASSSFVAGAASGAAAGAVGGTISGAGDSWMGGASFGQGVWKGFVGGNVGALTGGLLGGIAGGIDAYCDGRNAWTGKEVAMGKIKVGF